MRAPTFAPHAHAGFSAVTYIFPGSPGSMRNRDGRGDRSLIRPGGLHWTAAGSGLVHEEVPEPNGVLVEGLQIFVRQPVAQEMLSAVIHHVAPEVVPTVLFEGGSARVLAGAFGDVAAPFAPPSPLQLLDLSLHADALFTWHNPWPNGSVAVYLLNGSAAVDGTRLVAPNVAVLARGTRTLDVKSVAGARLIVFAGEPIDAPAFSNGPFVLSSEAALTDAIARYRRGEMGVIEAGAH